MRDLKAKLLERLRRIDGVEDRPSPVSGGTALFHAGKEFAHFHDANDLDLRLTKKVIRELALAHPSDSVHHPDRSPNSPWIEVRFRASADILRVVELVRRAVAEL